MRLATLAVLAAVLCAVGLIGCSSGQQPAVSAGITATLVGPAEIRVAWPAAPSGALGQVVQYRNQPGGTFITLAFLTAGATSYTHARLLPKTTFYYRVLAFFGVRTAPVTVNPQWTQPSPVADPGAVRHSLRDSTDAGPTDLHAQPVGAGGVRLTWTDHASDADGYLVEVTAANSTSTRVAAVLGPRIDQVGLYPLPSERTAAYRVVAFYYGPPSATVNQTTG